MNIRKPVVEETPSGLTLRADVSFQGKTESCFYSVPKAYADFADTDSSNCFLVGMLYPAMRYGEDIHVEGTVSARLLYNLNEYLVPLMATYNSLLKRVRVTAESTDDKGCPGAKAVGTGFSGGIDSFATIYEHYARPTPEGFKLTHLFFFNVGAHGIPQSKDDLTALERKFYARYEKLVGFSKEEGLPLVPVNSNVHWFHPWGHLEVATLATVSAVMFLQKGIRRYYLASAGHSYIQLWHYLGESRRPDDISYLNSLLLPWLSTEMLDLIDDGTIYDRSQKTELVSDYEPASRYLNVCCGHDTLDTNCSVCYKCCRTLLTLEILGKADAFRSVFDIDRYRREARRLFIATAIVTEKKELCCQHIMDLARERGVDLSREVSFLDLLRAKLMDGRIHTFIRNHSALKRLAKLIFRRT